MGQGLGEARRLLTYVYRHDKNSRLVARGARGEVVRPAGLEANV